MKNFLLSIPKGLPSVIIILIAMFFKFVNNPLGIHALKFPYSAQVGHCVLYFFVALVFILDYAKSRLPHHSKFNQEIALAAVAAVMALLFEIALMFMTNGLSLDLNNVYAAAIGAALGFLFYHFWLLHPLRHYLYHSIQHHWRYQHRRKKRK